MMFEEMKHRTREEHKVGDESYHPWATKMMKQRLLHCYLITNSKGEVAGGGCVWLREAPPAPGRRGGRVPYLLSMYTEPKFRRKGVATMIVKEAMLWASKKGYPKMFLHASRDGRMVYSQLGFKRTCEMAIDLE